jgi:hypothetical protein
MNAHRMNVLDQGVAQTDTFPPAVSPRGTVVPSSTRIWSSVDFAFAGESEWKLQVCPHQS